MKLLITGGHVTPALACIDYISEKKIPVTVEFVGRKYAQAADKEPSFEYKEIISRNIPFHHLTTGRLTRSFSLQSLQHLLQIPIGIFGAYKLLKKIKPNKILCFGGYLAVPIAIVGNLMNIPVYTHEQTIHPGLANRIIAKFAQKVFVSFAETANMFPLEKVTLTGNPIREHIFKVIKRPFQLEKKKPVIYVTGGSLGAHSINIHIEKLLPQLLKKYTVIHQCGNVSEYNDYDRLSTLKKSFAPELQNNYFVFSHFQADEIGYIFSLADLVISRSGANTFFELAALQKSTIFIPLPISAHGEQQKHAAIFANYNVGEVFEQQNTSEELLNLVDKMIENLSDYKSNFSKFPNVYVQKAAESIITEILKT